MRTTQRTRKGVTALLAMVYVVLFASLAIGFYAATTVATQVVSNEQRASQSFLAAESGMQFIRYQLASLNIPHTIPPEQVFSTVYNQLVNNMLATSNFSGLSISLVGNKISIPSSATDFVTLNDSGHKFRAEITQIGQQLTVRVIGQYDKPELARAIQLDYAVAQKASAIFNFGVASRGPISMSGNTSIRGTPDPANGSVLSTTVSTPTPITMSGSCEISGDVSMVNPTGGISYSGNVSIAGSNNPANWVDHVHRGVDCPQFPDIDTSDFAPYATTIITGNPGSKNLSNIRIRAGANPNFSAGTVIQGVMYVETPNKISFSGSCQIQGVIVVQNNPTGDVTTNMLTFSGNVSAQGPETLPASYGNLRNLKGAFILAPNFAVTMSGNFGTVGGSIVAGKMTLSGNAGGTVNGTVISMANNATTSLSGNSTITINSQGTSQYPAGVYFGSNFAPLPDTYQEVAPW